MVGAGGIVGKSTGGPLGRGERGCERARRREGQTASLSAKLWKRAANGNSGLQQGLWGWKRDVRRRYISRPAAVRLLEEEGHFGA